MTNAATTADVKEWGVLLKLAIHPSSPAPRSDLLQRLLANLAGDPSSKRLTGNGRDFTVLGWIAAPNAAEATRLAKRSITTLAGGLGIGGFRVIRAHAASAHGRADLYRSVDEHVADPTAWSTMLKLEGPLPPDGLTDTFLASILFASGGEGDGSISRAGDPDEFLADDGSGFTIRLWTTARTAAASCRLARARVIAALDATGLTGWSVVRANVATPEERAEQAYPGAAERSATHDGAL